MKIVVIDDAAHNQASARQTLAEHELTVIGSVGEAYAFFDDLIWHSEKLPDAVLTDLWMPLGDFRGTFKGHERKSMWEWTHNEPTGAVIDCEMIPAGLIFAIAARNCGVELVGICTDSDHHLDRLVSVMDLLALEPCSPHRRGHIRQFEARNCCLPDVLFNVTSGEIIPDNDTTVPTTHIKDWNQVLVRVMKLAEADVA